MSQKTLIVVLLDESGSMGVRKRETIAGFNSFLEEQMKLKDEDARFYLIKFNTSVKVVEEGVKLVNAEKLSSETYSPSGGTALYDAIRVGIGLAEEDRNDKQRVVCVIITDGEENSSRYTTKEDVKAMIRKREAEGSWTFVYIGENPAGWNREISMRSNAIDFDETDAAQNFSMASQACERLRNSQLPSLDNIFE